MKILSVGNFTNGWDGSICDEEHIAKALEELGHEVTRVQRDKPIQIPLKEYDFALIAQWDGYDEDFIPAQVRQVTSTVVYWAFDYQSDRQEWHERLVKEADLYLSKRIADSKYSNWQWLCQDFAPNFLDKYPGDIEQDIDVLFTGTYLGWADERIKILKAVDEIFHLQIHSVNPAEWMSAGFKHVNGPMMDDQLPYLYARAKINISIDHTIEAGYWSDRNAQIMCCGGLVLFRYVPGSTQVFGDHIEYFHNTDQALQLTDFYLKHPGPRELKAKLGYEFAQANLTVDERVKDLITIVKGIL